MSTPRALVRTAITRRWTSGCVLVVAVAGLVSVAAAASAHNVLRSTDPVSGGEVATAPSDVSLVFDEPAIALGTVVEVTGPDGALVSTGEPALEDTRVTQSLRSGLPAGSYRVQWRVTSSDGHPIDGEFAFTATGPATAEDRQPGSVEASAVPHSSGAARVPEGDGGVGLAVVSGVVLAALVLAGLAVSLRRRRGTEPAQDDPGGLSRARRAGPGGHPGQPAGRRRRGPLTRSAP